MTTKTDYRRNWKRWHKAGFTSELLPIIPPNAPMSEGSSIKDPGKTPGILNSYGKWAGLVGWPIFKATEEHLKTWKNMGAGVGMNVRNHPAIDFDVEDAELVKMIHDVAQETLGDAPVRGRGDSARILLMYRSGFKPKGRKFIFRMSDDSPNHLVELLGTQYVVEGIHKRGEPYRWREDNGYRHPCDVGPAGLTPITEQQVDRFFETLAEHVQLNGGTVVEDSKTKKRERSANAGKRVADEDEWGIELARRYIETKAPEAVQGTVRNTAHKVACGVYDYGVSEATCRDLLHEWNETKAGGLASEGDLEEVVTTGQTNRDTAVGAKHPAVGLEAVEIVEPSPELQAKLDAYWERQKKIDAMEEAANKKSAVGSDVIPKVLLLPSADFVNGFEPPDYVVKGLLRRRFAYAMTARTGDGKTAICILLVACVDQGLPFAGHEIKRRGLCIYFAGENPDDVRMRWLAMTREMKRKPEDFNVRFVPGVYKLSEIKARIRQEVGDAEVSLVVIDTSAAYFPGTDENNNVELGNHARMLRKDFVELPGGPCVVIACHPTKNADEDNLQPRGGGAYVAELDGNLTCILQGNDTAELHWQTKFRGPNFAPMTFKF
jgi:hypothetical protein